MALKLGELESEARNLARSGHLTAALAAYDQILATYPQDGDSRRKVADLLLRLGHRAEAVEVFRAVALHDVRSGHLLPGVVGCKVLESLGEPTDDIVRLLARTFAHQAPSLAKFATRQAPVDRDAPVDPLALAAVGEPDEVARRARARALDLSAFGPYPEQVLPMPFFSELPAELFAGAIRMTKLVRAGDGEVVVREGDPGSAFYFVASGEARVVAGAGAGSVERARLHEGALFGEMALLTDQPRTASVQVVGEADLLEVSRAAVSELTAAVPAVAERLERFVRERLLKNLLATSPLFKPFDQQQQMDLIRRFEGHEVAPGTTVVRENEVGQGLFVILFGDIEVFRAGPDGHDVLVARLRAGDVFGEMSLLGDHLTNASVRTATAATILFLGRDYFRRLVAALPTLRKYFEDLARERSQSQSQSQG